MLHYIINLFTSWYVKLRRKPLGILTYFIDQIIFHADKNFNLYVKLRATVNDSLVIYNVTVNDPHTNIM